MNKKQVFRSLLKQGYGKERIKRADLYVADLYVADLYVANLSGADLSGADLYVANLSGANLSGADLSGANLYGAKLSGANLSGANLSGAKLSDIIINENTFGIVLNCPENGSFYAYKKANGVIIELFIPASAKRSSATTYKCRCNKAKVVKIMNIDGSDSGFNSVNSDYDSSFVYEAGKVVKVDNYDDNRWNECSSGIHFFMSFQMAVNYR